MIFAELRKCSATGHVGELRLAHDIEEEQWLIKEDVRAVWEISEKVELFTFGQLGRGLLENCNLNQGFAVQVNLAKKVCRLPFNC